MPRYGSTTRWTRFFKDTDGRFCLIYIDDVIVYSPTAEKHLNDVEEVLSVLKQAGVSLKFEKCFFYTNVVRYLGHIIKPTQLEIDHVHVAALKEAKPPKNTH